MNGKRGKLYVMVGIPGSGKSHTGKRICEENPDTHLLSSDKLRETYFGDENTQFSDKWLQEHFRMDVSDLSDIDKKRMSDSFIFSTLDSKTRDFLSQGHNVVYDATNLGSGRRRTLLKKFSPYISSSYAVVVATPLDECLRRNASRERTVPRKVVLSMSDGFTFPIPDEGFDDIIVIGDERDIDYGVDFKQHGGRKAPSFNERELPTIEATNNTSYVKGFAE